MAHIEGGHRHHSESELRVRGEEQALAPQLSVGADLTTSPRLILLFGPPASGKLTIAKALGAITGEVIFANHDTIDFVARFLSVGTDNFYRTVDALREILIREMLLSGKGVIFTFAYSGSAGDTAFIRRLGAIASTCGATLHTVRVSCSQQALLQRVSNVERAEHRKLVDQEKLKESLVTYTYPRDIPGFATFEVDSESNAPDAAARLIAERWP